MSMRGAVARLLVGIGQPVGVRGLPPRVAIVEILVLGDMSARPLVGRLVRTRVGDLLVVAHDHVIALPSVRAVERARIPAYGNFGAASPAAAVRRARG